MNQARIEKMAHNVAAKVVTADELPEVTVPHIRQDAVLDDEDEALSNVDQAIDGMMASIKVLADNLPKIKVENIPL